MKKQLFFAVLIVLLWSAAMFAVSLIGLNRFNLSSDNAYGWMTDHNVNYDKKLENVVSLWDGRWYIGLAKKGYEFDPGGLSNVAFLPLYPLLMRGVSMITNSLAWAGLIINFFALVGAVYFLNKLAGKDGFTKDQASDSVKFLLIYPTAIFFAAVYTEALFVFLAILTFYWSKEKKFIFAGLAGMLAALTRIPGLFLIFPVLYYWWRGERQIKELIPTALIPAGTLVYLLLQRVYTGNALAFLTAQRNWGRKFLHINPDHIYWATSAGRVNLILDILFAVGLLLGIYYIYKKLDLGYAVFAFFIVVVPLATGSLLSIGRFGMVMFPLSMAIAKSESRLFKQAYAAVCLVLLTLYATQFVNGYWAG